MLRPENVASEAGSDARPRWWRMVIALLIALPLVALVVAPMLPRGVTVGGRSYAAAARLHPQPRWGNRSEAVIAARRNSEPAFWRTEGWVLSVGWMTCGVGFETADPDAWKRTSKHSMLFLESGPGDKQPLYHLVR